MQGCSEAITHKFTFNAIARILMKNINIGLRVGTIKLLKKM